MRIPLHLLGSQLRAVLWLFFPGRYNRSPRGLPKDTPPHPRLPGRRPKTRTLCSWCLGMFLSFLNLASASGQQALKRITSGGQWGLVTQALPWVHRHASVHLLALRASCCYKSIKPYLVLLLNLPACTNRGQGRMDCYGFKFIKVVRHPYQKPKYKVAIGLIFVDSN